MPIIITQLQPEIAASKISCFFSFTCRYQHLKVEVEVFLWKNKGQEETLKSVVFISVDLLFPKYLSSLFCVCMCMCCKAGLRIRVCEHACLFKFMSVVSVSLFMMPLVGPILPHELSYPCFCYPYITIHSIQGWLWEASCERPSCS